MNLGAPGLQVVVLGSLALVLGGMYAVSDASWLGEQHEAVWVRERGIFSGDRAVAYLPMAACFASGVVATVVARRFPAQAGAVELKGTVHELLALPLAILVSFRFDRAYDRWWTSRQEVESFSSDIVALAMLARVAGKQGGRKEERRRARDHQRRLFTLLEALVELVKVQLVEDSPDAGRLRREEVPACLRPEDAGACMEADDCVSWCLCALMLCIQEGEAEGVYQMEVASLMYSQIVSLQARLRNCWMVIGQSSPGPFVTHLRTFLLCWCFTFPFTILRQVQPMMILPMQMVLSFSVLGIEFCSREMEHPFGVDKNDIPTHELMDKVLATVREVDRIAAQRLL